MGRLAYVKQILSDARHYDREERLYRESPSRSRSWKPHDIEIECGLGSGRIPGERRRPRGPGYGETYREASKLFATGAAVEKVAPRPERALSTT